MQEMRQGGLSTRGIVISGVLGAVAIVLGATRIGFIPMPTGINATIMHVPAIIGGILEGPLVGALVGTIFGIYSFVQATTPMFKDPIVAIVPSVTPVRIAAAPPASHRGRRTISQRATPAQPST